MLTPHADDEVLGLGGTIARHISNGDEVFLAVLTGHGETEHPLWPESLWKTIRDECTLSSVFLE